jgi:hypothetical protein
MNEVTARDIARAVTRILADRPESVTPLQVASIYRCIGKFISLAFTKQFDSVAVEIIGFGTVVRSNGVSEFYPCAQLQIETLISKGVPSKQIANRSEMQMSKLAQITQLTEQQVN